MSSDYSLKSIRQGFKERGVFYTPPELAEYMKSLVDIEFHSVYDPTCGRGNLLSSFSDDIAKYGQDIEQEAIEYCHQNLKNFTGYYGDTLTDDKFKDMKFDLIFANPPFSIKYDLSKIDKENDTRFKNLPCLPPQSKADWAFMAHILDKLNDSGMAIILEFPGILYRSKKEGDIRKWFVDNNYIDTIIQVPPGKFTDTTISTSMIVLRKNKKNTDIKFVDIENELEYVAKIQEVIDNDYNLSVNNFCIKEEVKDVIDSWEMENTIRNMVIQKLENTIKYHKMIAMLEGYEIKSFLNALAKVIEKEKKQELKSFTKEEFEETYKKMTQSSLF